MSPTTYATTLHRMRYRLSAGLLALFVLVTGGLVIAQSAQDARTIPYQGRLELDGNPVNQDVPMTFRFFDAAAGGNQLGGDIQRTVTVSEGAFSAQLGPVPDAAFDGGGLFLEVVVDGVPLGARQQILAVPFAMSAGGVYAYADGNAAMRARATYDDVADRLNLTGSSGSGLHVESNGDAVADGALDVGGDVVVGGTARAHCPSSMVRLGTWCMDRTERGADTYRNAFIACHNEGKQICPFEPFMWCDTLNDPDYVGDCHDATDGSGLTWTAMTSHSDFVTSSLSIIAAYNAGDNSIDRSAETNSHPYFCCIPGHFAVDASEILTP